MRLQRVDYRELNSRQREIYNFQKIAAILADYGFNCIKLADDWQGADFLAYHIDGNSTLRVQLKGRLCIAKKYLHKNLHIAFPCDGAWYLAEHDRLVELIGTCANWLNTPSWIDEGMYSAGRPGRQILQAIQEFRLDSHGEIINPNVTLFSGE